MKSMENRATIYDVAKLAKVSAATVSRVLKGDSSVNASTYRRVEDAAAALKYERRLRQYPPQNRLIVLNMQPKLPGLGDVDWGRYVSALTDIGYDGYACIEVEDRAFEGSREKVENSLVLSKRYLDQFVI